MTRRGPEPVEPGRRLPADLDRAHYVEKIVQPIADSILVQLGQRFDESHRRATPAHSLVSRRTSITETP